MTLRKFTVEYAALEIRENALLNAMGYSEANAPHPLCEEVEKVLSKGSELYKIEGGYRLIDSMGFDRIGWKVLLENATLNVQRVIFEQIKKSTKAAVFVCTAGEEITYRSKESMEHGNLLEGYVYDVFGSVVVESAMDVIQDNLQKEMAAWGLGITNRFSPGYCGWAVNDQPRLFELLPEDFCGIELNDSCLMLPTKSVSGIIGIGESVKRKNYPCNICDALDCLYKNLHYKTV